MVAPETPGVYRLALSQKGVEQVITEPAVAVLMPFTSKIGQFLSENDFYFNEYGYGLRVRHICGRTRLRPREYDSAFGQTR